MRTTQFPFRSVRWAAGLMLLLGLAVQAPAPLGQTADDVSGVVAAVEAADAAINADGAERIVGDYRLGVVAQSAEPFTVIQDGVPRRVRPSEETHHVEVVLRDAATKRFLPGADVTLSVVDGDGTVVTETSLHPMWAAYRSYGDNVEIAPGDYTLRVDVAPPSVARHADFVDRATEPASAEFPLSVTTEGTTIDGPSVQPIAGEHTVGQAVQQALAESRQIVEVGDYRVGVVAEAPEPIWRWDDDQLSQRSVQAGFNHRLGIVLLDRSSNRVVPNARLTVTLANTETGDRFTYRPDLLLSESVHYGWNAPVPPGDYEVSVEIGVPSFARKPEAVFTAVERATFPEPIALGGERTEEPFTLPVVDDMGRRVAIPYPPQRVASITSFAVELLMELGVTPVARPDIPEQRVHPPEAKPIPSVSVDHSTGPNLEQLAATEPDLVVTSPTFARFIEPIQQALGVPVVVYDITDYRHVTGKAQTFGLLTGRNAEADALSGHLRSELTGAQQGIPEDGPSVFALFGTSRSFLSFLPDTYLGSLVELLGGRLITEGRQPMERFQGYTSFSMENVVAADPDVILIVRHGPPSSERERQIEQLTGDPAWQSLTAVQEGRVYELPEWLYVQFPGPRVTEAIEGLRAIFYPDAP